MKICHLPKPCSALFDVHSGFYRRLPTLFVYLPALFIWLKFGSPFGITHTGMNDNAPEMQPTPINGAFAPDFFQKRKSWMVLS